MNQQEAKDLKKSWLLTADVIHEKLVCDKENLLIFFKKVCIHRNIFLNNWKLHEYLIIFIVFYFIFYKF